MLHHIVKHGNVSPHPYRRLVVVMEVYCDTHTHKIDFRKQINIAGCYYEVSQYKHFKFKLILRL